MKKVYLITNYFHFKDEKSSNRYREFAEMLSKEEDIELEVITSDFYHRKYEYRKNRSSLVRNLPYKVTFIHELGYKKNICIKRLVSSQVFADNLMKYIKSQPKPDLIYQVVPTLDCAYAISKYAKKNHIPLILDIQDLWPEAFKMAFDLPVISDIVFWPLKWKAEQAYKKADAICAVSQTYVNRALRINKSCVKGEAVYIGINLKDFDENVKKWREKNRDKEDEVKGVKLAYCGSLSKSYDIKLVIDALATMENPPIFIVMGDGTCRTEFEAYAIKRKVKAVFTGFLSYEEMCGILSSCDITINPIIGTSVASIINKHGDYAACGLPVINTQDSAEYCDLIEDYQMGFNAVHSTPRELADKIKILMEDASLRCEMGKNSRRCAEEKFDRRNTYKKLVRTVKRLL